jgi:ABC-type antimicrobial peptide transport system permease subunit
MSLLQLLAIMSGRGHDETCGGGLGLIAHYVFSALILLFFESPPFFNPPPTPTPTTHILSAVLFCVLSAVCCLFDSVRQD